VKKYQEANRPTNFPMGQPQTQQVGNLLASFGFSGGAYQDWAIVATQAQTLSQLAYDLSRRILAAQALDSRFEQLRKEWLSQTRLSSSPIEIAMSEPYQQIIGMGPAVVPLIIRELKRKHNLWFWALRSITGANPVKEDDRGDIQAMTQAWLDWAKSQGYV
jgi:hypothetical protein